MLGTLHHKKYTYLVIIFFNILTLHPTSAKDVLTIGVSLGITGKYSQPSSMQKKAYELWEKDINKKGLLGKRVKVIIENDEGSIIKARRIYRSFIKKKVDLVFAPYSSELTTAIAPIIDKAEYPMLVPGASADVIWQSNYTHIFGMWTPASRYTVGMLKMALLNGLNRVAIVYANDGFSKSIALGTRKWGQLLGLNIVSVEAFNKGARKLSWLANKLKKKSIDLLIVAGHFNESIDVRRAIKNEDWLPKAYFATVGPTFEAYFRTLKNDAEFSFSTSIWEPHKNLNFPGSHNFTKKFINGYGIEPSYHAATAYAAGQIIETAISFSKSFNREKIRQALSELDTYTIVGRYGVDRTGMQVKRFPLIIQWQKGVKEIVWPPEHRTSNPVFLE